MRKLFFFLIGILILGACDKVKDTIELETQYSQLRDNETKFIVSISDQVFYETTAIFDGHVEVRNNYFVMNMTNQYKGNFILNFSQENWINAKKIPARLYGSAASSLMIGKVVDSTQNKGAGYLMSDGFIEPITISKSKIIFYITGNVKKYPNVSETDSTFKITGYILAKNLKFAEYSLPN
jgi:hypothetical protein